MLPFVDSRRLTGANLFFVATGAILELAGVLPDEALLSGWRERVARARAHRFLQCLIGNKSVNERAVQRSGHAPQRRQLDAALHK